MSLGLTRQHAEELRRECGSNVITTHRVTAFDVLRRQVDNPLLLLLVVAALLSTLTGQPADGVIIGLILALSIGLGFTNEYRSERHMAALHMRIQHTAVVWRDGDPIELPAHELVPGDVVELKIGSLVPADGDVLESRDLEIDESMLTGESLAVGKSSSSNAGGWDDTNRVLMGSIVQRGSGRFRVTSIGGATQFGGVVRSLGERAPVTRFQSGLSEFSGLLSKFAGILIVVTFIVNLAFHRPVIEASLFCLSIAIGITPQLLPAIVSLSLSVGAHHLAARKVLVKRLVTIEDLGNINVLFTDKTGTITEGRIAFDRAVPIDDSSDSEILRLGLLCNEAIGVAEGKPEGATLDVATWLAPNASIELLKGATVIDVVPFDHVRRMTSVVARDPDGTTFVIVKGAPEAVLSRCAEVSSADRASLDKLFADGMRVVAIATQATTSDKVTQETEAGLSLRGYLTFFDRPRTDAGVAVHRLAELGVRVKIITGDNGAVARKVCGDIGIPVVQVLTGDEIDGLDDPALSARVDSTTIFSRVSPAQKARIIRVTRAQGVDVAFLGDGVNDAAALHSADVGISVDSAVDVAKEAADIVLLDKSLSVIADGIVEGRRVFNNTLKYVLMATSSNFGNMFSAAGASFFLGFLPLLPSQVLLNNLLYDLGQMAIPTDRVDDEALRHPAAWDISFVRKFMLIFGPISSLFDFATFFVMLVVLDAGKTEFRSGWFIESLATQTLVVFVIRTRRTPFFRSHPGGFMWAAPIAAAGIGALIPFSPIAGRLGFSGLPLRFFAILVAMTVFYLVLVEVAKVVFYSRLGRPVAAERTDHELSRRHLHRRAHRFVKHEGPRPLGLPSVHG